MIAVFALGITPALAAEECCKTAKKVDGWCAKHKAGFKNKRGISCKGCHTAMIKEAGDCKSCKIVYAKGKKINCPDCKAMISTKTPGWCKACKKGNVNGVRSDCKSCLKAAAKNGWCKSCDIGFANGRKISCKECHDAATSKKGGWCKTDDVGWAKGVKTMCKDCVKAIAKNK